MFSWIRRSVKNKIVAVNIFVTLFFGLAMLFITFTLTQKTLLSNRKEFLLQATISESYSLNMSLDKAMLIVDNMAHHEEARDFLEKKTPESELRTALAREWIDDVIKMFFVVDKKGEVFGLTEEEKEKEKKEGEVDFSDKNFFPKIAAGEAGAGYCFGFTYPHSEFYLYSPVFSENGELLGAVVAEVNKGPIFESLTKTTLHEIGDLMIVSDDGIITHSTEEEDELKSLWPLFDSERENIIKKYEHGKGDMNTEIKEMNYEDARGYINDYQGPAEYSFVDEADNKEEIAALSKVGTYPIYLVSGFETKEVTKKVLVSLVYLVILGGMAVAASTIISISFSGHILKPMKLIRVVVESISRGHYDQDIPIHTQDEFKELGNALDGMAKELKEKCKDDTDSEKDKDTV